MAGAIEEHGWDGEWFRRAYDDFGEVVGSSENEEGQIYVETQGICVMSGWAPRRAWRAGAGEREGAARAPSTGSCCCAPRTALTPELGEITTYPPGYKGNSGVVCHANRG